MEKRTFQLQDYFLNTLVNQAVPVTVFLLKGQQIRGLIKGFDQFSVTLDSNNRQQMIMKQTISTIIPQRPVALKPPQPQK
ncbi:RNA chaperone Hfq [Alicyclobacillus tolerans]|uniref:RNA chaperone Hfq n=1 Tax=Alicyclobacillus tolerans TaxID=90970 RepID=UPI001F028D89|nr:RNA chaperone Hfq [Alicyclobacillus tolerans]MCF8566582.1 RNA chaperone Hfq [Alicyclobacillus tolerans]